MIPILRIAAVVLALALALALLACGDPPPPREPHPPLTDEPIAAEPLVNDDELPPPPGQEVAPSKAELTTEGGVDPVPDDPPEDAPAAENPEK